MDSMRYKFETNSWHCVVSLSQTLYPPLSTCSNKEDRKASRHDCKNVDLDLKLQHKQTNTKYVLLCLLVLVPHIYYGL